MKKLVFALLLFIVAGGWWLRQEMVQARPEAMSAAAAAAAREASRAPAVTPAAGPLRLPLPAAAPAVAATPAAPAKLALGDDALRVRLDEQIPARLYQEAARCYRRGGGPDERLDLSYHINVSDGLVTFSNLTVTDSTLSDRSLEQCIKSRIVAAKWRDEQLPDLDEEDDVFMRVYNLARYAANDDSPSGSAVN